MPWTDGLTPEEIGHAQNKGWATLEGDAAIKTVYQSYRGLEKLRGVPSERVLTLPENLNDEAAVKPLFHKLGVPETADKYDFTSIKGADGKELPAETVALLRGMAHVAGTTQAGALRLATDWLKWQTDFTAGQTAQQTQAVRDAEAERGGKEAGLRTANAAALQGEWLANFDVRYLAAERMAGMVGYTSDEIHALKGTDKFVPFMRRMDAMVKAGAEAPLLGHGTGGGGGGAQETEEQLLAEKETIMRENKGKMLRGDEAAKVFGCMAEIDRKIVMARHGRRS